MRLSKLLICYLLICTLALPMALGESEEPVVTEVPAQMPAETPTEVPAEKSTKTPAEEPAQVPAEAPTQTPAEEPTQVPAEEPTQEPAEESTETPTQEPANEPTQEPANEPTQEPANEPTQEPANEPTQEPANEPTQEPANEPTQVPAEEPTEAPGEAPSEQPADSPSQEPSLEPTQEPEPSATIEPTIGPAPTITPEAAITPEPTITPEPAITPGPVFAPPAEPGNPGELVVITCEGNAKLSDGVWAITANAPDANIGFSWTVDETAMSFYLFMDSAYLGETAEYRTSVSSQDYMNGQHTLYVGALLDDGSITWGSVNFRIASGGKPGGRFPGGRPSGGSRPSGGAAGTPAAEEQGFHITPGKALASKHSSGTKNTAAYTCSEIDASAEAITALVLGSTQTEITLDGGAAFFASKDDGKLHLIPESEAEEWQLNVLAMNTLAESGIDRVVFHVGSTAYSMPARMEFGGSIYASLRAKGYVSKDMEIRIDAQGMRVYVDGRSYSINDANEFVPCEE